MMVNEAKNNLDKIIKACREMHVTSLYLVGSGTRVKDFTAGSDVDFTFKFLTGNKGIPTGSDDYFDFVFKVEAITGLTTDLIADERIRNKYFLRSISEDKIKIYET